MESLYPQTPSDWIALIGVMVPLFTWIISGAFRTAAYWSDQKRRNWQRFSEVCSIIYNKDGESGLLKQEAALLELENIGVDQAAKKQILGRAADHYKNIAEMGPQNSDKGALTAKDISARKTSAKALSATVREVMARI